MTVMSADGWPYNSIDIKTAFLHDEAFNRYLYLRPPKEFNNESLWKQKKLCTFFVMLLDLGMFFFSFGVLMCSLDHRLCFIGLRVVLFLVSFIFNHADDFCCASTASFVFNIVQSLTRLFYFGSVN